MQLAAGEYYVRGDNSPVSEDSRTWPEPGTADAKLLVGKPLVTILSIRFPVLGAILFSSSESRANPVYSDRDMTQCESSGEKSRFPSDGSTGRTDKRCGQPSPADPISRHLPSSAAIRETIEQLVLVFVSWAFCSARSRPRPL